MGGEDGYAESMAFLYLVCVRLEMVGVLDALESKGRSVQFAKLRMEHPFADHIFNEYNNEKNPYSKLCPQGQRNDNIALIDHL